MDGLERILNTKSTAEIVILLIVITLCICGFLFFLPFLLKKLNIKKASKDGIEFITNDKIEEKKSSPHAKCIHGKDILLVLQKQAQMFSEIQRIKSSILAEQMKYAEIKSSEMNAFMRRNFSQVLMEKLNKENDKSINIVEHEEYRYYQLCIRVVYTEILDLFRNLFRDTQFLDKSEKEFRRYIDDNEKKILQQVTDTLNDIYNGKIVSRTLIFEENKKFITTFTDIIQDVLWHSREISIKSESECERIHNEFDIYIMQKIG